MNKVITINLNGNAYQLDDAGYEALRTYLDDAAARLKDNPDRAEIILDLEQAIGEKCQRYLGSHKNVVTAVEVTQIINEMGPVNGGAGSDDQARPNAKAESQGARPADAGAPKRLYQIREGALISGVCNGLAAFFNIDVSIIRILFVVLALGTSGAWILVYIVMMFVIPYAETSEERAAARGCRSMPSSSWKPPSATTTSSVTADIGGVNGDAGIAPGDANSATPCASSGSMSSLGCNTRPVTRRRCSPDSWFRYSEF
jgi:phage shock protein PspC (stress-responsive transcriptional regulator)